MDPLWQFATIGLGILVTLFGSALAVMWKQSKDDRKELHDAINELEVRARDDRRELRDSIKDLAARADRHHDDIAIVKAFCFGATGDNGLQYEIKERIRPRLHFLFGAALPRIGEKLGIELHLPPDIK